MSILSFLRRGIARAYRRMSYAEYLRSPHWMATRAKAIRRAGNRCQVCNGSERLEVHHRTYDRIGHESAGDLIVLCRECHQTFHAAGRLRR